MRNKFIGLAAIVAATVSVGCLLLGPQVPKCSDQQTLDLVRQVIAESLGATGENLIPIQTLRSALTIELPHATSLEENIKKYSCNATLLVKDEAGTQGRLVINYTAQLDDKDRLLVSTGGFDRNDQIVLVRALNAALRAQSQQRAATNPAPEVEPAITGPSAADAAMAADPAQTADSTEPVENTPRHVTDDEAIRNQILSGTGGDDTPKFTDYPVSEIYSGPSAQLDTSSEEARTFKTRLSEALARDPVDFAGEYTSAGWGCGTMCFYITFINKRTGQVIKSGLGGDLGPRVVKFLPGSELLIAEGGEVDDGYNSTGNYAFFYRLQNGELQLIKRVPVPK